jgi:phosphohistidine phosphatase
MLDFPAQEIDVDVMRRLMLLRHAKSDWSEPRPRDHERVLAARGRTAAPKIGTYMARHALVPDLAICSTATRARETWDLVAAAFDHDIEIAYDPRLYEVAASTLLAVIKETARSVHSLIVIGHNPGLRDLAEHLMAAGDVDVRQQLLEKFPTAALAVIDFPTDDWSKLHPRAGRLDRFVYPRMLETTTD